MDPRTRDTHSTVLHGRSNFADDQNESDKKSSALPDSGANKLSQSRIRPRVKNILGFIKTTSEINASGKNDLESGGAPVDIGLPPICYDNKLPDNERKWSTLHRKIQSAANVSNQREFKQWPSQETTHQSIDDWEMGFRRALDTCHNRSMSRGNISLPSQNTLGGHRHSLANISVTDSGARIPQHHYGEEGCEWMDAYASFAPQRDSPFEPAPPVPPGVMLLELTTENLKAHDYALSLAQARERGSGTNPKFQPFMQDNYGQTPNELKKKLHSEYATMGQLQWGKLTLISAITTLLWLFQLVISIVATIHENVTDNMWTVVYVSSSFAFLCSILQLVHDGQSMSQYKNRFDFKFYGRTSKRMKILPSPGFQFIASILTLVAGSVCLYMHAVSLSFCEDNNSFRWLFNETQLTGLCNDEGGDLLIPLVALDTSLVLISLIRLVHSCAILKRHLYSAAVQ